MDTVHVPDLAEFFDTETLSDVKLLLFEEADAGTKGKRKREEITLPGHSMVLVAFSTYCKAKVRTKVETIGVAGPS